MRELTGLQTHFQIEKQQQVVQQRVLSKSVESPVASGIVTHMRVTTACSLAYQKLEDVGISCAMCLAYIIVNLQQQRHGFATAQSKCSDDTCFSTCERWDLEP